MKVSKSRYLFFLTELMMISIALENIKLFNVLGTCFKPTHVIFIIAIISAFLFKKGVITKQNYFLMLLYLALPAIPLYRIPDILEWFKSYIIWALIILYLFVGFDYFYIVFQSKRIRLIRLLIDIIIVVQILGIVQFVLMNTFGIMFLTDSFGAFQFTRSYLSSKNGIYRAFSVFHEPSVLGWVNSTQLAIVLFSKREQLINTQKRIFVYILCGLTMISSVSSTGVFLILAIIIAYFIVSSKNPSTVIGIIVAVVAFVVLWNFTSVLNPAKRLFIEYGTVNTSGYERINAPTLYAKKTLQYYPFFGRGIGISGDIDNVGMIQNTISGEANNSFFEVIMNFGLSSIFLYIPLIKYGISTIKKNNLYAVMFVNLLGVLFATGAYLSLDFLVVLNITMFLFVPCEKHVQWVSPMNTCVTQATFKRKG